MDVINQILTSQSDQKESYFDLILKHYLQELNYSKGVLLALIRNDLHRIAIYPSDITKDEYVTEYQDTFFDRIIKTKSISFSTKKITIPFLNDVSYCLGLPLISRDKIIGLICLARDVKIEKECESILISPVTTFLKLLIDNYILEENIQRSGIDDRFLKTKDLFLASMSHEIRTPLNGIIGYTQLLLQTKCTEVQKQYFVGLNKCSLSLMQIINDILDYSKLSSGKMKVSITCVQIKEVLEFVHTTLLSQIQEKSHDLKISISDKIPKYLMTDRSKLIQILINLLSNAIKFTPSGGKIEIKVDLKDTDRLFFSIKDSGVGISPTDQKKLFHPFTQLESPISKEGTGLGLVISKKLVELFKGEIGLNSSLGFGSEFYFTIYFQSYEEAEDLLSTQVNIFKDKNILIFSPNLEDRIELCEILIPWKIKAIPCGSVQEVIKMVRYYDLQLCIIDNDVNLIKQLKDIKYFLPIITVNKTEEYDTDLFDGCITKPYNKVKIYETLNKLFQNAHKDVSDVKKGKSSLLKILIAEDIRYSQDILKNLLYNIGYSNLKIVDDGIQVIQEIRKDKYDILLLDLKMPKMNGFQVLEYLKSHKIDIKVIPITASVLEEDQRKCQSYGLKYFLKKPIDIKELKDTLILISS